MRRLALVPALIALALPLAAVSDYHGHSEYSNHGLSVSIDDWEDVRDCSALHVRYNDRTVPVVEENVPVSSMRSLRVRSDRNGSIRVVGSTASTFGVKACKASALGNANDIRVNVSGNEVSADHADNDSRSIVYFIVSAPRNGTLDLDANNGPISIDGVDGSVTAHALNGPIALKDSTGTLDIHTQNGPISFAGNSGKVTLRATNGPISVKLAGSSWTSGNLDASTENGPLSLKVPASYGSGVHVETDGNSPVSCRGAACRSAKKAYAESSDDDEDYGPRWPRRIDLGSGTRAVTLTTHNGPVSVKEGD
ncbi:MAG: DUF4097 family beta strand repeat protein [Acidobacteria bacterium]|nr:DUF4097 family beta strand repeat protein [Acidobacteriota bacterium]MBV9071040.1 DUF4097 family beta strand repeat protein [Acidobacteriota bacterium]MBV9185026.1 DUF4097 family beta strand repeat protein [Acidobacteriota bacterium]